MMTGCGVNSIYYKEPSTVEHTLRELEKAPKVKTSTKTNDIGSIILENLKNRVKRQALGIYAQQDADLAKKHLISPHVGRNIKGQAIRTQDSSNTIVVHGTSSHQISHFLSDFHIDTDVRPQGSVETETSVNLKELTHSKTLQPPMLIDELNPLMETIPTGIKVDQIRVNKNEVKIVNDFYSSPRLKGVHT